MITTRQFTVYTFYHREIETLNRMLGFGWVDDNGKTRVFLVELEIRSEDET